jgi:two-component system, chemotaxis family, chemotaxis protein CheY
MGKECILIVDDDRNCLEMVRIVFESRGFRVACATNGAEALMILKSSLVTLMLTDYNMPGMNGLTLSEEAIKAVPGLRIIMVTGDPVKQLYHKAEQVGIAAILKKPFNIEELLVMAWTGTQIERHMM